MVQLKWYGEALKMQIDKLAQDALEDFGNKLVSDIKESMKEGHYRLWRSKRPGGGFHWSAAPGLPPAPDTERLKRSISWAGSWGARSGGKQYGSWGSRGGEVIGDRVRRPYYRRHVNTLHIGTRTPYWHFQEFGTSKARPRPFLFPAYRKRIQDLRNLFSGKRLGAARFSVGFGEGIKTLYQEEI